jgi:S-formylglutathione hydrolase
LNKPEIISRHPCFGGVVGYYTHESTATRSPMRFGIFLPPQAESRHVPVLYFLAGLTCTEETFMIKAGAQRLAAELGIALVAPDTSPRGLNLPGDTESWDFGVAAGFYLDATAEPWAKHYRMYSYVADELPTLIAAHFPIDGARQSISGHSMGGHGALTIALKNPGRFRSVSAFAPIAAPMTCPWGEKAFSGYLGANRELWRDYDATSLVSRASSVSRPELLVDQGQGDQFLAAQLRIDEFEAACKQAGYPLKLRRHQGYDHGYYFIATFIEDHLRYHARALYA